MTRREFAALPLAARAQTIASASSSAWYEKMYRCGQINFNERDAETLDIASWLDYWTELRVNALLLNAGGILAFYPTAIPYHRRAGKRDLFGEFSRAAKQRGIRVVARLDPNWAYEEAFKAHPEWFERNAGGSPRRHGESPWLFKTCMFSPYFSEQIPAIMREVNKSYDVDGFFTNGWPGPGRPPECRCENCRGLADRDSERYYDQHLARVLDIWRLWDDTAKEKKADSVYVGNLGGGIRAVLNLRRVGGVAGWFNADHQGRSGTTPVWDCAQQGRVARSAMKGKMITNVTGSYANTRPLWRHTSKAPAEARMWLAQTTASGMVPWYHWLGGSPEDRRWRATGREFYQWIAKHEAHFANRRAVANLGVVFSQRMNAWYKPPGGGDATEFLQGLYYALLEGRFVFEFIHEDDLRPESLARYPALVLPNTALLTAGQVAHLRTYVQDGGSLVATFESGRPLADLFGIEVRGEVRGPAGNASYARIEAPHEIWAPFRDTRILPGAEYRLPVKGPAKPLLTVIPPYPAFPPEMVYPREPRTDEPAIVVAERGESRRVYFPGDVDRSFWRSMNPDLGALIANALRWVLRGKLPVTVTGEGLVELFAWETQPGWALHVLNYTNPNAMRGWFRAPYRIGPQRVRMMLPETARVARVMALRAETQLQHSLNGGVLEFTIPGVEDYEIAAIVAG